jgi:CRISPR-associated protein Csb2
MSLTIAVRFLTGLCGTARSKTDPVPEWPPHPARLYMALAAAHFECARGEAERAALEWLEGLPPPAVHVSGRAIVNEAVPAFVPMNDAKAVGRGGSIQTLPVLKRHRAERLFPRVALAPEEDSLYFNWPEAPGVDGHRETLSVLCALVGRLGHSSSLAQVWVAEGPGEGLKTWQPVERRPAMTMRVVSQTAGTLERLETAFRSPPRYRPVISMSQGYSEVMDAPADAARTVFDERVEILRLEPAATTFRHLQLETTLALTATLRAAILQHCPKGAPESISGHGEGGGATTRAHVACFPLGFVGHEHANGHLLGVGIAFPRGMAEVDERLLLAAIEAIADEGKHQGSGLGFDRQRYPGLGQWRLVREGPLGDWRAALQAEAWTGAPHGATRWASVTPLVYDQHGKAKDRAAYLAECCASVEEAARRVVGAEVGVKARVSAVSEVVGVPPARDFPRMKRKDGSERRHTHVVIEFDRPVVGPLLVGAGRFRGYGLLRPMDQKRESE